MTIHHTICRQSPSCGVAPGGHELTLSLNTDYDDKTGVVQGEQALSRADEDVAFLRLPLRFRLIRPGECSRLAAEAGCIVQSVRAGFCGD